MWVIGSAGQGYLQLLLLLWALLIIALSTYNLVPEVTCNFSADVGVVRRLEDAVSRFRCACGLHAKLSTCNASVEMVLGAVRSKMALASDCSQ